MPIRVDVRLVAATNRRLDEMVEAQRYRDDLYYRLNVFPIAVPPLRERLEDVKALVHHFVDRFARRLNRFIDVIGADTLDVLRRHSWPGNVRELENLIHRAVILSSGVELTLPPAALGAPPAARISGADSEETLEDIERARIMRVLAETNWIVSGSRGAAERLGLKRTTLQSRLKRLGLVPLHECAGEPSKVCSMKLANPAI